MTLREIPYPPLLEHIDADRLAQLDRFGDLLFTEAMPGGFIGECTRAELTLRHLFDSILPAIAPETRTATGLLAPVQLQVFDLGAGSGLPSLPLAILFPQHNFHLLDAQEKRCRFAESAASALGLKNVKVYHTVVQDFPKKFGTELKADVVVFRAFRKILASLELALHVLAETKGRQQPESGKPGGPRSLHEQTASKAPEAGCPPDLPGLLRPAAIASQSPKVLYWRSQPVPFSDEGFKRVDDLGYSIELFSKFVSAEAILPRGLYIFNRSKNAAKQFPRSWKKISDDRLVETES